MSPMARWVLCRWHAQDIAKEAVEEAEKSLAALRTGSKVGTEVGGLHVCAMAHMFGATTEVSCSKRHYSLLVHSMCLR